MAAKRVELGAVLKAAAPHLDGAEGAAVRQALTLMQTFPGRTWAQVETALRAAAASACTGAALRRRAHRFVAGDASADGLLTDIERLAIAPLKELASDLGLRPVGTKATLMKAVVDFVASRGRVRPAPPSVRAVRAPRAAKTQADPMALAAELRGRCRMPPRTAGEALQINDFAAEAFRKLDAKGFVKFATALGHTLPGKSKQDKLAEFQRQMNFMAGSRMQTDAIGRVG